MERPAAMFREPSKAARTDPYKRGLATMEMRIVFGMLGVLGLCQRTMKYRRVEGERWTTED